MNKQNILRDFYKMRQNGHCERLIVSEELREALEKSGKSVREYFETDGEWIFGTIIYPRHRDAFFYTLATGERRFIEGTCFYDISDEVLLDVATEFINDYANQVVVDRDICDVFEGNLTEAERKALSKVWYAAGYTKALITYELDHYNERFEKLMLDVIEEKNQNVYVTEAFMVGIFRSQNVQMHQALQKLLLSSIHGDSCWSAICDHAFAGSKDSVESLLELIVQNNLLRHNSIRRSVGMQLGLAEFNTHDLKHVSKILLSKVLDGLRSGEKREFLLQSATPEDIYIGLWCTAYHGLDQLEARMEQILTSGGRTAVLTTGYFLTRKDCYGFGAKTAMEAIRLHHDDKEVLSQYIKVLTDDLEELHFGPPDYGRSFYDLLMRLHDEMPGKGYAFSESTFPWHHLKMKPGDIVRVLFKFNELLKEEKLLDQLCLLIPEIDADHRYTYYTWWLSEPKTVIQRKVIIEAVGSRQEYCRRIAMNVVSELSLNGDEYLILEQMLRKKDDETRRNAIRLLLKQNDDALYDTVCRLLKDKKEEKRTAGLDMVKQLQKDQKRKALYERCRPLLAEKPVTEGPVSGKEKLLKKSVKNLRHKKLYMPEDVYHPVVKKDPDVIRLFMSCFPSSKLGDELLGEAWNCESEGEQGDFLRAKTDLKSLRRLIREHKKDTYTGCWGDVCRVEDDGLFRDEDDQVPLQDIWTDWYEHELKDHRRLIRAYILLLANFSYDENKKYSSYIQRIFGKGYELEQEREYWFQMHEILEFLTERYTDSWERSCLAQALAIWLIDCLPDFKIMDDDPYYDDLMQIDTVLSWMKYRNHKELEQVFPIKAALAETRFNEVEAIITVNDYLLAASKGLIPEEAVYAYLFNPKLMHRELGELTCLQYERRCRRGRPARIKARNKAAMSYRSLLKRVYHQVMEEIFAVELHRGDISTPYSHAINHIGIVRGVPYFVQLLTAIGDRPFDRSGYVSSENDYTRTSALCVMLRATRPSKYDTAETLRDALAGSGIKTKRLIEAALYVPDWIEIIDKYLQIPGFASTCYYFLAHMKHEDLDDWLQAKISRYTPLTLEELHSGAFDLGWFHSIQKEIDDKTFKQIYQAAKYIADGSSHTRGRKYADAALGLMTLPETETLLLEKRNKDLLMAYPLIPLRDEKDILHRYMFLQDFLKESRKFGAQRRESERLAVERAVKNLAVNAGYSDEIRLILRMESQLTDDLPLTDKERKRVLKQQTLRAKNMLEQAMIDEIKFSTEEVQDMMHHQIMGELVRNLAWRWADESGFSFGFIDEEKLQELQAKNISTLVAAHPVTLFEHGALEKLKTEIVQNEIIQPFQQIYRDVFLQDEGNGAYKKLSSISGIKIIGRRGKRILAGRRWVYDGYDGMEKTFYAQNVIAALIARSDWMDEDFPILDYIEFHTRYDYERMEICQVPAIVLSEVLRDVQMMVSLTRMEREG